jgi:hypothetical protein
MGREKMTSLYIGPAAVYRRFLAGLSVTEENVLDDDSLWVVEKAQRYQLARMGTMLEATKP